MTKFSLGETQRGNQMTGMMEAPKPEPIEKPAPAPLPKEIGGQKGPEPTRYGDWEKNGRCTDF
jgi:hypothetical protein